MIRISVRTVLRSTAALLLSSLPVASWAASSVAECTHIDDPDARLACYDAAAGRASPAITRATIAPVAPVAAAASPAAVADASAVPAGLGSEQLARPADEPAQMQAKIVSVAGNKQIGRWTVTLDNGQVWEQREASRDGRRPKPGDTVTIRRASMNSYMMTSASGGASRVGRVK